MAITNWSSVESWDGSDPADIAAATLALANSARDNLVPHFASTGAAQTAAAARIAANAAVRLVCTIEGTGALYAYTGAATGWQWIGNTTPLEYSYSSGDPFNSNFSATAGWPMLAGALWAPASYTFTPTRTGWASVSWSADTRVISAGFGYANMVPYKDGNIVSGAVRLLHEDAGRAEIPHTAPKNVFLTAGTSTTFTATIGATSNAGGFGIYNLTWHVVQQ